MLTNEERNVRLDKWIAALRSGEYKQCTGQFHSNDGHCCLGIAEIVAGYEIKESYSQVENFYQLSYHSQITKLEELNDGGHNFNQIADYIEENIKKC